MRQCLKCGELKETTEFYKVPVGDGITRRCRECKKKYERERRKQHPEIYRDYELRSHFKIPQHKYDALLVKQNGVCAICKKPEKVIRRGKLLPLTVDHNHACCSGNKSCGKCIRGLLCFKCNSGLGYFIDSPELLIAAAQYLKSF